MNDPRKPIVGGQDPRRIFPYEPALDGLRAIALIGISGYHANIPWLNGGFLGVDLFFVLSGYLITRLMLAEWQGTHRIELVAFWERRIRRLFPGMLFLLAGIVGYAWWLANPALLARMRGDLLSTLFYFNNWWQIARGQSYFEDFAGVSPLHHAWSLSIEEQCYLVLPLFVLFVLKRGKSIVSLFGLLLAGAVVSAVWTAWLHGPISDPSRVYYGTDTRSQEVLMGAALACAFQLGWLPGVALRRYWGLIGGGAGVVLLSVWILSSDASSWLYEGGFFLVSILASVVIAAVSQPAPNRLARLLSIRPIAWLGRISYGFYLWHLVVYLVLTRAATGLQGPALVALRFGATLLMATFSFYVIEQPIRRGALSRRALVVGLLVSSLSLASLAWLATEPRVKPTSIAIGDSLLSPFNGGSMAKGGEGGEETRVLLVGDSIAWSLGNGFLPSFERGTGLEVVNRAMPGCGLAHGPIREHGRESAGNIGSKCEEWPEHWRRYVSEIEPDLVVILVGGWDVYDRQVDGEWLPFGGPRHDQYLKGLLRKATNTFQDAGVPVVWLSTPYYNPEAPASVLPPLISERWRTDHFNALLGEEITSGGSNLYWLDLAEFVCPDTRCLTQYEGGDWRTDGTHFSTLGAQSVGRWLAPQLRDIRRQSLLKANSEGQGESGS